MAFSLADLKAELRITSSHEDALLTRKLAAAQDYVETAIGAKLAEIDGGAPASLEETVLRLAAHLYEWRGVATDTALTQIPAAYQDFLRSNRYGRFADGGA